MKEKSLPDFYLAPLNGLSHNSFRILALNYKSDFCMTELVWAQDILENKEFAIRKLKINQEHIKQTIIHICSKKDSEIRPAIEKIKKMYPEITEINYNMGCPQSTLSKTHIAGGILHNPDNMEKTAAEFYDSSKACNINPSIKLRIGTDEKNIHLEKYIDILKKIGIRKFYIHGRHLKQGYQKPSTKDEIIKVKKENPELEIVYNGDINSIKKISEIETETKMDGYMIGRFALTHPDIFNIIKNSHNNLTHIAKTKTDFDEQVIIMKQLIEIGENNQEPIENIKKSLIWISKGFEKGSEFRQRLNNIKTYNDLNELLVRYSY